jgi:hypothetical protein
MWKLCKSIAVTFCLWHLPAALAAANGQHPPMGVDRPSPVPCCADGYCYPNPYEWGYYRTNWRRWPTDCYNGLPLEVTPPGQITNETPSHVAPPAEEEDRRAPTPTPTLESEQQENAENGSSRGSSDTGLPPLPPLPPASSGGLQPRSGTPYSPSPQTPRTAPLNNTAPPTGDLDPPPELPFRSPVIAREPAPTRTVAQPLPAPSRKRVPTVNRHTDDPPPNLPVRLASYEN